MDKTKPTAELVEAARGGDADACEALYNQTARQMMGLARSMLGHEQDAMDVLQDSYLYAFRSLGQLEHPEYFSTWLYRIVANRCKNFLTRTRPKLFAASLSDEDGGEWDMEDEDMAARPDESADLSELRRLVLEMVESLPEDQRLCILLYYYQDKKVAEIAELLDLPENTVKSRLNYARKKIRAQAEALESAGTILHGVTLLPLLPVAFDACVAEAAASGGPLLLEAILQGTATAGGVAAGAAAAGTTAAGAAGAAAGSGAATGVSAFFGTLAGKIATGVVIAGLAVGGGAALLHQPEPEALPEPEPEPVSAVELARSEPEPIVEFAEEDPELIDIFNGVFEDQAGLRDFAGFHLRVLLSEPCELFEFDPRTADIHIGLQPGERFRVSFSGEGGGTDGPAWTGDPLLEQVGGDALAPLYEVVAEGSGILECLWTDDAGSYVHCRIHLSVPGQPPAQPEPSQPEPSEPRQITIEAEMQAEPEYAPLPEPEASSRPQTPAEPLEVSQPVPTPQPQPDPEPDPEPETDTGYYTVSYQYQQEGGGRLRDVSILGIELDDTYVIVLENEVLRYRTDTYQDNMLSRGYTVLTPSEAEDMDLVRDLSYGNGSVSFTTTAERYLVSAQHEETGLFGYGQPTGNLSNNHVIELYEHDDYGYNFRKLRSY